MVAAENPGNLPPMPMTEAEYLAFDAQTDEKYEYRQGRIYPMSGGTIRHSVIAASTGSQLDRLLEDRDCTVTNSDLKLQIASKQTYRFPDVMVFCGDAVTAEGRNDIITNPVIVVEVVSPESARRDLTDKLEEYMQIDTLDAYLVIMQDEPHVMLFRRDGEKWTVEHASGLDATMRVPVSGDEIELGLAELYRRVRWEDDDHNETAENPEASQ
jgi:Uma2 family endonuclease